MGWRDFLASRAACAMGRHWQLGNNQYSKAAAKVELGTRQPMIWLTAGCCTEEEEDKLKGNMRGVGWNKMSLYELTCWIKREQKMVEPLRMSLGWAVHMGEEKWPAREEVWVGEGIRPGFKENASLKLFFF
jgi:hypothetical protein